MKRLPFRELETLARARLPRFFSLFHTRISAEQTFVLQQTTQIAIYLKKSARNGEIYQAVLSEIEKFRSGK